MLMNYTYIKSSHHRVVKTIDYRKVYSIINDCHKMQLGNVSKSQISIL